MVVKSPKTLAIKPWETCCITQPCLRSASRWSDSDPQPMGAESRVVLPALQRPAMPAYGDCKMFAGGDSNGIGRKEQVWREQKGWQWEEASLKEKKGFFQKQLWKENILSPEALVRKKMRKQEWRLVKNLTFMKTTRRLKHSINTYGWERVSLCGSRNI